MINFFIKKHFINIINRVIDKFYIKLRQNDTFINPNLKNEEFKSTNLTVSIHISIFN